MEATVPATSVHLGDNKHHFGPGWMGITDKDAITDAFARLSQQACAETNALTNTVNTNGTASVLATERTGAAAVVATTLQGASGQLATEKTGAASVIATNAASQAGQLATAVGFANTQNQLINGFKDGRFDAANYAAAAQVTMVGGFKDIALAECQNTNLLQLQASGYAKDAALAACQNTAALTLLATQNAAAIAAQLAECCCELKEKISTRADVTDALIRSIDERRGDRELQAAQAEIMYLKGRVIAGTPV